MDVKNTKTRLDETMLPFVVSEYGGVCICDIAEDGCYVAMTLVNHTAETYKYDTFEDMINELDSDGVLCDIEVNVTKKEKFTTD